MNMLMINSIDSPVLGIVVWQLHLNQNNAFLYWCVKEMHLFLVMVIKDGGGALSSGGM